jgi:hypothetical protein
MGHCRQFKNGRRADVHDWLVTERKEKISRISERQTNSKSCNDLDRVEWNGFVLVRACSYAVSASQVETARPRVCTL